MKDLRKALFLIILLFFFVSPALAQEDVLPLFGGVQPGRVTVASVVVGTGYNQREYYEQDAQNAASIVKQYSGQFTPRDSIQPYTWNFETWQPIDYTPLVFKISVLEKWDEWGTNWRGELVYIQYEHINSLACYDTGNPTHYECRQYQGSRYYEMSYHVNSILIEREKVMQLAEELGL